MATKTVFYSKSHKGFLIRLIQSQDKFLVNIFTGNGTLHSHSFTSLSNAYTFLNTFIKSLKKS